MFRGERRGSLAHLIEGSGQASLERGGMGSTLDDGAFRPNRFCPPSIVR